MMKRYLLALLCMSMLMAACGSSHDGELLWNVEIKKAHKPWAAVDSQRLYLCADDVYCFEIDTGRLLWERKTFGAHSSAPFLAGGSLFFQCGGLYALDAATGTILWEFWTKKWATIAPVADVGRVYAPVGDRLYCLDAVSGKRLWSVRTGSLTETPVLIGPRLFYTRGKKIVCLDASSGQVLWRFMVGSAGGQLAATGEFLLSVGREGLVTAHKVETGQTQWQRDISTPNIRFCVLPAGQILISAGTLYLLNSKDGVPLWIFQRNQIGVFNSFVLGNRVFVRSSGGKFFCVALHDGTLISRFRRPDGSLLLKDTHSAIFIPGFQSRKINCLSVPSL